MKERTKGVLTGVLTTCLILGITTTALAASGAVSFNRSPIQFNGEQISAAGEDYALDNGCMAPSSITYTDEKGGGTTYLPARRIAELMGVGIGYDAATGAVTVSDEAAPTTTPAPDTTASVADYSDWTAEEEAAYQEFKGMWEWEIDGYQDIKNASVFCGRDGRTGVDTLKAFLSRHSAEAIDTYSIRLTQEINQQNPGTDTVFRTGPNGIGTWLWICSGQNNDWISTYKDSIEDVDKILSKGGM